MGAAVSAVREAVKALSWALAAAMRPSMSMLALGVNTRGLALLGVLATTGVVALDSSSAHTINTSFEIIPPTFLRQRTTSVQCWSMSLKDPAVSCSHRQYCEARDCKLSFMGCRSNGTELMQTVTYKKCMDRRAASRPLAIHLHGCAAGQW